MKIKLTLTLDQEVIPAAKEYARKEGTSLSHIVENHFDTLTSAKNTDAALSPKVSKLLGVIKIPNDFDRKKELGNILAEKYQ